MTPIVAGAPVFNERMCFGQRYTLGPICYRFLVRPASIGKSLFEIVQCCLRYVDLEVSDVIRRGGDLRSLVGATLSTHRHQPRGQYTGTTGCGSRKYELTARDGVRRYSRSFL